MKKPRRYRDIIRLRLRSLFAKDRAEHDLDRELRFHLEEQIEENISAGMSREEARRAALRSLGGTAQIGEECRDMRRTSYIETLWNDLRFALRILGRTPGFTAILLLTMALSIGATSAIFSVIQGVLLRPLPFAQPDRIVRIFYQNTLWPKFPMNHYDFRDIRARNRTFGSMAIITRSDAQLSGSGEAVMVHAFRISAGYFRTLGLKPARGREFTTTDELPGHGRQAILSDRLWRTRFAADPNIIGRTITLNTEPFVVTAVMPPGVEHPGNEYHSIADGENVDLWTPFVFEGNPNNRGSHFTEGIARLRDGVSVDQAIADLNGIITDLGKQYRGSRGWKIYLVPLYTEIVGSTRRMLFVLMGAVALLLLIACVNAASLLLARATARAREIAVRAALGAARRRIVRQLLTESLVIATGGALLGTVVAFGGVQVLRSLLPPGFPRAGSIRLDPVVFGFTLATAMVTGLIFGIVPALISSRTDLQQSLRDGGRGSSVGRHQLNLRNALVIAETALACVLLIGAGLMLRSFVNLLRTDPGFRPQQVLTASVSLPGQQYNSTPKVQAFFHKLDGAVAAIPGARTAGIGSDLPWTGYDENLGGFRLEGQPASVNEKTTGRYHMASADYFRALGIPLVRGRFFDARDDASAPHVFIINETLARFWPSGDAIGKRVAFFTDQPQEKDWWTVVGIVRDIKDKPEQAAAQPAFWWPLEQMPWSFSHGSIVIRSVADPLLLANQFRTTVHQLDPGLAVADLRVMTEIADESVAKQRFALFLVGLFAVLALLLAAFGIYGVISWTVSQRMNELGTRMALGASSWDLVRMILGHGLRLSIAGSIIGTVGALVAGRVLASLLFEVRASDPVTFALVPAIALVTSALACYLPARRATGADPMHALRSE